MESLFLLDSFCVDYAVVILITFFDPVCIRLFVGDDRLLCRSWRSRSRWWPADGRTTLRKLRPWWPWRVFTQLWTRTFGQQLRQWSALWRSSRCIQTRPIHRRSRHCWTTSRLVRRSFLVRFSRRTSSLFQRWLRLRSLGLFSRSRWLFGSRFRSLWWWRQTLLILWYKLIWFVTDPRPLHPLYQPTHFFKRNQINGTWIYNESYRYNWRSINKIPTSIYGLNCVYHISPIPWHSNPFIHYDVSISYKKVQVWVQKYNYRFRNGINKFQFFNFYKDEQMQLRNWKGIHQKKKKRMQKEQQIFKNYFQVNRRDGDVGGRRSYALILKIGFKSWEKKNKFITSIWIRTIFNEGTDR